jgi:hypothetical protein
MNKTVWPAFVKGNWYSWKPLPGMDPGLDESMYRLAAAKWASSMADGKPEAIAHQEAEAFVFETVYGVSYPTKQSKGFRK